jgi:uncharacterized protein (DUF2267 family)
MPRSIGGICRAARRLPARAVMPARSNFAEIRQRRCEFPTATRGRRRYFHLDIPEGTRSEDCAMPATGLEVFDTTVQKTNAWLKELMGIMDWTDRHRAYLALRAVLHALRDRLTVDEVAQLAAQLPMLVRGFYYEGWDPSHKPVKIRHKRDFLAQIAEVFVDEAPIDAEGIARGVFRLLESRVSEGEIEDVHQVLPEELRELWPAQPAHP